MLDIKEIHRKSRADFPRIREIHANSSLPVVGTIVDQTLQLWPDSTIVIVPSSLSGLPGDFYDGYLRPAP